MILHSCSKPAAMALRNEPACEAGDEGDTHTHTHTHTHTPKKNKKQVVFKGLDPLPLPLRHSRTSTLPGFSQPLQ